MVWAVGVVVLIVVGMMAGVVSWASHQLTMARLWPVPSSVGLLASMIDLVAVAG